jgi:hypothetical protein
MRLRRSLGISLTLAGGAAAAALFTTTAQGTGTPSTLSFLVQNRGTEYITAAGSTSVFPGRLQAGDRILTRDALLQGGRSIGYDNELCTVTFDSHDLCQVVLVVPGKGQIQASWLWIRWPSNFSGVIDGGTGAFADASGQFTATVLPKGALRITATLT